MCTKKLHLWWNARPTRATKSPRTAKLMWFSPGQLYEQKPLLGWSAKHPGLTQGLLYPSNLLHGQLGISFLAHAMCLEYVIEIHWVCTIRLFGVSFLPERRLASSQSSSLWTLALISCTPWQVEPLYVEDVMLFPFWYSIWHAQPHKTEIIAGWCRWAVENDSGW